MPAQWFIPIAENSLSQTRPGHASSFTQLSRICEDRNVAIVRADWAHTRQAETARIPARIMPLGTCSRLRPGRRYSMEDRDESQSMRNSLKSLILGLTAAAYSRARRRPMKSLLVGGALAVRSYRIQTAAKATEGRQDKVEGHNQE